MDVEEPNGNKTYLPKHLSDEVKWGIIISIKYFSQTYSSIEQKFQVKSGTISKIWQKYQNQGNINNNYLGNQNARQIFDEQENHIKDILKDNQAFNNSLISISSNIQQKYDTQISKSSLQRIMRKLEYKYGAARYIHQLNPQNKEQRIDFCKNLKSMDIQNIAFSDEAIFSTSENGFKVWYHSIEDKTIKRKQYQYKDRQIHVWACISAKGKSQLYVHENSVNSVEYKKCLQQSFIPFKRKFYRYQQCQLLQDGAPSHVSKETLQFTQENKISILQNPPWSPDINPIELIWAHMKKSFRKANFENPISTRGQLIEIVQSIWDNISDNLINNVIKHVTNQLDQIIQKQGEYLM